MGAGGARVTTRLRPMSEAPRDGTALRLHLRDGTDFVGLCSDRWWGWIALLDPWPLIRGDIRFTGWEPVADEEVMRMRRALRVPRAAAVAIEPVALRPKRAQLSYCDALLCRDAP